MTHSSTAGHCIAGLPSLLIAGASQLAYRELCCERQPPKEMRTELKKAACESQLEYQFATGTYVTSREASYTRSPVRAVNF